MELDEALKALEEKEVEIVKLKEIKADVVHQRDEIKKKYGEVETKLTEYEATVQKTVGELEAERKKREEISALHTASIKTAAIKAALVKEGVIAVDTALKLVKFDDIPVDDTFAINTDAVSAVIGKLKETDTILFSKPTTKVDADEVPKPKRAAEGEPKAGFAEELKNCKTAADVETLLKKHGKM